MENTQHSDVAVVTNQVRDPIMAVKKNADVPDGRPISISELGELAERLGSVVYALNRALRCGRVVRSDVFEDIREPAFCFSSPDYFRHERMRRCISSFETTRPASASARPRSIMT